MSRWRRVMVKMGKVQRRGLQRLAQRVVLATPKRAMMTPAHSYAQVLQLHSSVALSGNMFGTILRHNHRCAANANRAVAVTTEHGVPSRVRANTVCTDDQIRRVIVIRLRRAHKYRHPSARPNSKLIQ